MTALNVLSLFSGIGGLELGLERAGMTTVGQVELDPYCRRVLAKHWPEVPKHDDVRTAPEWWFTGDRPTADVICGGFPCQDISVAGKRAGIIDGERSSLWTYMARTVRLLRPHYVVLENVSAILVRGLDVVAADLAEIGYDLRWDCVPAASLGAPHRRDRWFGVAYPNGLRRAAATQSSEHAESDSQGQDDQLGHASQDTGDLADAESVGCRQGWPRGSVGDGAYWKAVWPQVLADADADGLGRDGRSGELGPAGRGEPADRSQWATEPDVGRVANGVPSRVDRLRALGNAVVPQVAEHVGRLIVDHAAAVAA